MWSVLWARPKFWPFDSRHKSSGRDIFHPLKKSYSLPLRWVKENHFRLSSPLFFFNLQLNTIISKNLDNNMNQNLQLAYFQFFYFHYYLTNSYGYVLMNLVFVDKYEIDIFTDPTFQGPLSPINIFLYLSQCVFVII